MSQQEFQRRNRSEDAPDGPEAPLPGPGGAAGAPPAQGVDALLDEIDSVLETNAESFVRGFVQKGGQ